MASTPWFWDIYTWVKGETVPIEEIDSIQTARDLAGFIAALQQVDSTGAPRGRGIPLAERDKEFRYWLTRFTGDPAVAAEWERALAAPPWDGPPVWHHGDLDVRNWLVQKGRISGVIDWDAMGMGDPACDVMVAWKLHSAAARDAFRGALPTDDATWERARGWVLSQAIAALAYYTPQNNPTLYHEAESWLALVLSEREETDRAPRHRTPHQHSSPRQRHNERRVGRGREPTMEMAPQEVLKLLRGLEDADIKAWLDGGWGVDALLGTQRRQHDDLDLVVELADVPKLRSILERDGYELLGGGAPMSFEMVDGSGRQADVHPVTFNEHGDGVYKMRSGEDWVYPAAGFGAKGQVLGQEVRCLSPEVQMLVHTGYELTEKDHQEIQALQERFGVDPPQGYSAAHRRNR